MRLLGYILLIGGFYIIHIPVFHRAPVIHAMCIGEWNRMPHQERNNREDVILAMEHVANKTWEMAPWPTGGALIMLVGGILAGIGSRRKRATDSGDKT